MKWHYDPAREIWQARTGDTTWAEVPGTLDQPPAGKLAFQPEIDEEPADRP
jgi:hypothetical protein